jgi:hypothetical protein
MSRLTRLVLGHDNLKALTSGCRWPQGRAYFRAAVISIVVRHSEQPDDALSRDRVRSSGFKSNGNTTDREGTCEHFKSGVRTQDQVPHCDGG